MQTLAERLAAGPVPQAGRPELPNFAETAALMTEGAARLAALERAALDVVACADANAYPGDAIEALRAALDGAPPAPAVWDVILHNEGEGVPILFDVVAPSPAAAVAEAWRQYNETPHVDGAPPPTWTRPRVGRALDRREGESPVFSLDGDLINADHCRPMELNGAARWTFANGKA